MVYNRTMKTVNLEAGHPDVATAKVKLYNSIYSSRAQGAKDIKIIHGYGSSGTGGAIRRACLSELASYKRRGIIKDYCPGDKFGPMSQEGRDIVSKYPRLKSDSDWARSNDGITVVVLK